MKIMFRLALVAVVALAALPPGYEDKLLCPAGYCKRAKHMPAGWVGPRAAFHECWNQATNDVKSVTPWGKLRGGQLALVKLTKSGYSETECPASTCVDKMQDGKHNYCDSHLISEYGCKHPMTQFGCAKSCGTCGKKKTNGGCCVSFGFGSYMKECCQKYTAVKDLSACKTANRMGGSTVFEANGCSVSQDKHEGKMGCCVSFGLGAMEHEVQHHYHSTRENSCDVNTRSGGKTVFEHMTCSAAQTKHEGSTHVSSQDPGCCVSYGYGSRMVPCCHKFSATTRGTCQEGTRMGGATKFEVSFADDVCAASKKKYLAKKTNGGH